MTRVVINRFQPQTAPQSWREFGLAGVDGGSEQQKLEDALWESDQCFRIAFEQAGVGMAIVGPDGQWLRFNRALCDILGYSSDELLKLSFKDFIGCESLNCADAGPDANAGLEQPPLGRETSCSERHYVRKDGSPVWVRLAVAPVHAASGDLRYFISVIEDITERKLGEERERRMNEELERRVRERSARLEEVNKELAFISYYVSHDVRVPLRLTNYFIRRLRERAGSALDQTSFAYLGFISESVKQAADMVDGVLSFSQMGCAEIHYGTVDLEQLVDEILMSLAPETAGRSIVWKKSRLGKVRGDPLMLRLALQNLISNAVKYTRGRDVAKIEIRRIDDNGRLVFSVQDNGIGFDMRDAGKLFGVFQRLPTAQEFEGTGIGLANVRRIIGRHGGETWAESSIGRGATFYFSLPRVPGLADQNDGAVTPPKTGMNT
jgi:PAS domain S-box-containing protein